MISRKGPARCLSRDGTVSLAVWLCVGVCVVANAASAAGTEDSRPACFPEQAADGPGAIDGFRSVRPEAALFNAEGRAFYQKGQWSAAREKYRAAEAADPDFVAPALNIACSFVRQERFAEATAAVVAILARAYLPWSAEILAAADLGALKVRGEWSVVAAALEGARKKWAEALREDVLFVARMRRPLGFGDNPSGVFVLGPKQEVFAWSPRTLRTRQLTAEDGRIVALLPAPDRGQAAYVVAEKVLRQDGRATALRGVSLVILDLDQLLPLGRRRLDGDIRRLDITTTGRGFVFRPVLASAGDGSLPSSALRFENSGWIAASAASTPAPRRARGEWLRVTLLPSGVARSPFALETIGPCRARVREKLGTSGIRQLELLAIDRQARFALGGPHGAGLFGLAIP